MIFVSSVSQAFVGAACARFGGDVVVRENYKRAPGPLVSEVGKQRLVASAHQGAALERLQHGLHPVGFNPTLYGLGATQALPVVSEARGGPGGALTVNGLLQR